MWPPHSPTRTTKNSTLKLAGAFHLPNTSRIRFWAFSYSIGEPCGRSNQLITYFIDILLSRVEIVRKAPIQRSQLWAASGSMTLASHGRSRVADEEIQV